jgi:predicted dehydrogenase
LIIGCGNMAGGYDLSQPDEAMPLGHAKAFRQHGSFEVTACIDPNAGQREAFQNRWQVPQGFASWSDLSQQIGAFDVISICSPTGVHIGDIQAALALKPRLIFCEKPVTLHVDQTQQVVTDCANNNVLLAVNHSRRWSPEVLSLRQQLTQGEWGAVRSVSAVYNKGMLNNGSHMLDLMINLFGSLRITHVGDAVFDHFDADPSVDACLQTSDGVPIQLNLAYAKDYALFEMQIVTEKGVINMEDGGARWRFRTAAPSIQLPGYNFLGHGEWLVPSDSPMLRNAVANLFDALSYGVALACTGLHALQAQTLCEQIQQRALARLTSPRERREVA